MPPRIGLPIGFRLRVDSRTLRYDDGRVLLGGSPRRALRLSDAGAGLAARLLAGEPVRTRADAALARRLVDAGIAHPVPPHDAPQFEVVVPVYADHASLDACLTAIGDGCTVTVVDDGSPDPRAIAGVAAAHGARLVRLPVNAGPAAARNAGASTCTAEAIAFVDADAVAHTATLQQVAAHLADPLVAAAAPRVCPDARDASGLLRAFASAASPLDLGNQPAAVAPGGRVAYVPSTVLVVRRTALLDVGGFNESLRYGEDVDLVWRLLAAGHRVRYDPDAQVLHHEPGTWSTWLRRRYRYGTSAGELARRHGDRAAPLVIAPAPAATVALALAGAPALAGAVAVTTAWRLRRRLRAAHVPAHDATRAALVAPAATALAASRWTTQLWAPLLLTAGARSRRARLAVAAAICAPPAVEWLVRRPAVDPLRWTVAFWADDAAYGLGVWRGCVRARTARALLPALPRRNTVATTTPAGHRPET